ncbi:MAG: hypothetical protein U9R51_05340 [Actinomycetota bacterium]|nr:hypothetical protein [Actinomycetota bacterium]
MKRASRILIPTLTLFVLLSGTPALTAPAVEPDVSTRWVTVVGGTGDQREAADWAVTHFVDAGLDLPQLVVAIHTSDEPCDGFDGAFRSRETPARLDVCNPHRLIILHELAHAWDHHMLTDSIRLKFMNLRGLTSWNDATTPWKERGIEDLAEMLVWGLRQFSGTASFDKQPEKEAAFALITGIILPDDRGETVSLPNAEADQDRSTDDTEWDSLH